MNTKLRQFFIFFIGLGVSIGLDQFTKHLAVVHLKGPVSYTHLTLPTKA